MEDLQLDSEALCSSLTRSEWLAGSTRPLQTQSLPEMNQAPGTLSLLQNPHAIEECSPSDCFVQIPERGLTEFQPTPEAMSTARPPALCLPARPQPNSRRSYPIPPTPMQHQPLHMLSQHSQQGAPLDSSGSRSYSVPPMPVQHQLSDMLSEQSQQEGPFDGSGNRSYPVPPMPMDLQPSDILSRQSSYEAHYDAEPSRRIQVAAVLHIPNQPHAASSGLCTSRSPMRAPNPPFHADTPPIPFPGKPPSIFTDLCTTGRAPNYSHHDTAAKCHLPSSLTSACEALHSDGHIRSFSSGGHKTAASERC